MKNKLIFPIANLTELKHTKKLQTINIIQDKIKKTKNKISADMKNLQSYSGLLDHVVESQIATQITTFNNGFQNRKKSKWKRLGSAVTSLEKLPSLELCPIIERVSSKAGGKRPPLHKVQNKRVQIPPLPIITIDQFEANRKVQKSNSPILRQK